MSENWKPVIGFEGYYCVSNLGRVRSFDRMSRHSRGGKYLRRGKILSPVVNSKGYGVVTLYGDNESRIPKEVQRVVLEAFVGECPHGHQACHNDGNPLNNRLENLRYDTIAANNADKYDHGTQPIGSDHAASKLSENDVVLIRRLYATDQGADCYSLGKRFGVSPSGIHSIVRRKCWTHIDDNGNFLPLEKRGSYSSSFMIENKSAIRFTALGESMTLREWASRTGISKQTLWARIKRGWTPEEAVSTKTGECRK